MLPARRRIGVSLGSEKSRRPFFFFFADCVVGERSFFLLLLLPTGLPGGGTANPAEVETFPSWEFLVTMAFDLQTLLLSLLFHRVS